MDYFSWQSYVFETYNKWVLWIRIEHHYSKMSFIKEVYLDLKLIYYGVKGFSYGQGRLKVEEGLVLYL